MSDTKNDPLVPYKGPSEFGAGANRAVTEGALFGALGLMIGTIIGARFKEKMPFAASFRKKALELEEDASILAHYKGETAAERFDRTRHSADTIAGAASGMTIGTVTGLVAGGVHGAYAGSATAREGNDQFNRTHTELVSTRAKLEKAESHAAAAAKSKDEAGERKL